MIRPLNNNIILKPDDPRGERGKSKLFLPDTVKDKALDVPEPCAYVVAVGPGILLPSGKRVPLTVKVGDKVRVNTKMVCIFHHKGELYASCTEDAIIAILDGIDAEEDLPVAEGIIAEIEGKKT